MFVHIEVLVDNSPVTEETHSESEPELSSSMQTYCYSVKIMNPARKSDYVVRKLQSVGRFKSVTSLKCLLRDKLATSINLQPGEEENLEVGYIAAGHGLRGKQCWVVDADDIEQMYEEYEKKKEIFLWCFPKNKPTKGKKRARSPSPSKDTRRDKYNSHGKMVEEVDEILKKLEEKHAGNYDETRLRAWAHMVHIGTHKSLDDPPDKPYFKTGKKASSSSQCTTSTSTRIAMTAAPRVSPSKRLDYRSKCIDQLQNWHELLEKGAITQEQYDALAQTILEDMHT